MDKKKFFVPLNGSKTDIDAPETTKTWFPIVSQDVPEMRPIQPSSVHADTPRPPRVLYKNIKLPENEKISSSGTDSESDKCTDRQRKSRKTIKEWRSKMEKTLKEQTDQFECSRNMSAPTSSVFYDQILPEVDSPIFTTELRPQPASRTESQTITFVAPKKIVGLTNPKSGIFLNEKEIKSTEIELPWEAYDPRKLQSEIDQKDDTFVIVDEGGKFFAGVGKSKSNKENGIVRRANYQIVKRAKPTAAERRHVPMVKKEIPQDLSLGAPIGVQFGTINIKSVLLSEKQRRLQELATVLTAFAYSKIHQAPKWTAQRINYILTEGKHFFEKNQKDLYNQKTTFKINLLNHCLRISLDPPLIIGNLCPRDSRIVNIFSALTNFFDEYPAGVLKSGHLILLIWRTRGGFFIFDSSGRTLECCRNTKNGFAALLAVRNIKNVTHLITRMSNLEKETPYSLTPIEIARVKREFTYKTRAMAYGCVAAMVSELVLPLCWDSTDLRLIATIGDNLCETHFSTIEEDSITLHDIPAIIKTFKVRYEIVIVPDLVKIVPLGSNTIKQQLKGLLKEFKSVLLQTGNHTFAVWSKDDYCALFNTDNKNPCEICVRIFGMLEALSDFLFNEILKNKSSLIMMIHGISVLRIDELDRNIYFDTLKMPVFSKTVNTGKFKKTAKKLKQLPELTSPNVSDTQFVPVWDSLKKDFKDRSSMGFIGSASSVGDDVPLAELSELSLKMRKACQFDIGEEEQEEEEEIEDIDEAILLKNEICLYIIDIILDMTNRPEDESVVEEIEEEMEGEAEEEEEELIEQEFQTLAKKILLKSDLKRLEYEKRKVLLGIESKILKSMQDEAVPRLTLSQEIKIPSHFTRMPDGSEMVYGFRNLIELGSNIERIATIVSVSAILVSHKYSIATWNEQVVDFVLDLSLNIDNLLPQRRNPFLTTPKHGMKVQVGSSLFSVTVSKMKFGHFENLHVILHKSFDKHDRVAVLSTTYSFSAWKRHNYFYLYEGYPCNFVGFHTQDSESGVSCIIRFTQLKELVRRVMSNRGTWENSERLVVSTVDVHDITLDGKPQYLEMTESREREATALLEDKNAQKKISDKLSFFEQEILKEKARAREFEQLKTRGSKKGKEKKKKKTEEEEEFPMEEFEEGEVEDEGGEATAGETTGGETDAEVPKQKNVIEETSPAFGTQCRRIPTKGFTLISNDGFYKIQGMLFLSPREIESDDLIRECFFASCHATLAAIHCPLEEWDFRHVDNSIECGRKLYKQIRSPDDCQCRRIQKVLVDEFYYELMVKIIPLAEDARLLESLDNAWKSHKYLLLQFHSSSFAILKKDNLIYLFDPYKSQDKRTSKADDGPMIPIGEQEAVQDRNTASWIAFPHANYLLKYLDERVNLETQFLLHTINVLSFERAPKSTRYAHYFLDKTVGQPAKKIQSDKPKPLIEQLSWIHTHPTWTRMSLLNEMGIRRGTAESIYIEYDIERNNDLFSMWSDIHPLLSVFKNRGKQHLAVGIVACLMVNLYRMNDFNREILNSIVIEGSRLFDESILNIDIEDYEVKFDDLKSEFSFSKLQFSTYIEPIVYGQLYNPNLEEFNLGRALNYFFDVKKRRYGIILCSRKVIAFGKGNLGYFMFDCQSFGNPLFLDNQGAAYLLYCTSLARLLHCIVMTLRIPQRKVQFVMHTVEMAVMREGMLQAEEEEEEAVPEEIPEEVTESESEVDKKKKKKKEKKEKK